MIPEPQTIGSRIHADVPGELRLTDRESAFAQDIFRGRRLGSFLEGPAFAPDGTLFTVDIAHGRILALAPDGGWSVTAQYDGMPNGMKRHPDGRLFVADRRRGVMVVDPANGRAETFLGPDRLPGYKGLNDLFFASNGDLYFTDQGSTGLHDPTGRVFRLAADGTLDCLIANVPSPNGLVMDPGESELYVAVTRTNEVWRIPFREDGSVHRVAVFCRLIGGMGPDGMAVDRAGNLAVAHAGGGQVWLWSPDGVPIRRVVACDGGRLTTNVAYGGPDNRSLYITNSFSENILVAEMPEPGEPMYGSGRSGDGQTTSARRASAFSAGGKPA